MHERESALVRADPRSRGAWLCLRRASGPIGMHPGWNVAELEKLMFEDDGDAVSALFAGNDRFRQLHDKHQELKKRVHAVEAGNEALDEEKLVLLKKEKLLVKDKLAAMVSEYRQSPEDD